MRIKLGEADSWQHLFKFKIGDIIRLKRNSTTGVVISADCFTDLSPYAIFYRIRLSEEGRGLLAMEDDIEPVENGKARPPLH